MASARPSIALAYLSERFPLRLYAPLAGLFGVAACAGDAELSPARLLRAAAVALPLVLALRLGDDLADIERDREEHPERALARASRGEVLQAKGALAALVLVNLALAASVGPFPGRAPAMFALSAGLVLWYSVLRCFATSAVVNSIVNLLKYPALVFLVAPSSEGLGAGWPRALAAGLVYFTFVAYEILHDPRVRAEPSALPALGGALALMVLIALGMGAALAGRSPLWAGVHAAVTALSSVVLMSLFLRSRRSGALVSAGGASAGSGKGVFVVCLLITASFELGLRP